jgi:hypothetical protein
MSARHTVSCDISRDLKIVALQPAVAPRLETGKSCFIMLSRPRGGERSMRTVLCCRKIFDGGA